MASQASPVYTQKTILQHRPFRTMWLAQFVSIFGDFLALFAVISLITFKLHGTAVQVTTVTIAYVLPLAIISPAAGVFVDHWNVKRVMVLSDLIRALLITMLVFVTDVGQISIIFILLSAVSSFFAPAQSVAIRTLVPMEGLMAANATMTQAFYLVRLFSPFAAGALITALGERACFWLDVLSFIFSAAMISTLTIVRPPRAQQEKTLATLTQDFLEGNKFIFTHAGLAFVFIAMALAMFVMSSFSPLISIYIRDSLQAGPFIFGLISSMVGIGLIVGSQALTRTFSRQKAAADSPLQPGDSPSAQKAESGAGQASPAARVQSANGAKAAARANVVPAGLLGLGAGAALLGVFHNIPMAALATFTMGFAISYVLVPAQTMSQQETPPAMIGRVSSTFLSLIALSQVLGLLLSGYLAHALGIRPLFLASATVLALIAAAGYLLLRGRLVGVQAQRQATAD
jgi:DHA3 family macrolide efflux protein-like MFS transporter